MSFSNVTNLEKAQDKSFGGFAIAAIFIGVSMAIILYLTMQTEIIQQTLFTQILFPLILGLTFLILVAIFANYQALKVLKKYAREIILISYLIGILFFVGGLVILGLVIVIQGSVLGFFMLGFGALIGIIIFAFWGRIKEKLELAAQWMKLASTIVLNEPGMLVLSFIQSIIVSIGMITQFITLYTWYFLASNQGVSEEHVQTVIYFIVFIYLWFTMFVLYYFDGANVFISYARLKNVDPTVGQGISAASAKIAAIASFAFLTALVTFITTFIRDWARKRQSRGGSTQIMIFYMVVGFLSQIARWLYHLVSFFTLPSIIIKRNSIKEAMNESFNLFKRNLWNVIFADMGFGYGVRIMYIITAVIAGAFGFGLGYILALSAGFQSPIIIAVIIAIIALIFGVFVTKFFVRPLYTSFSTAIYVYAAEGPEAILMDGTQPLKLQIEKSLANPKANPNYKKL
jgi:hypothetical protein